MPRLPDKFALGPPESAYTPDRIVYGSQTGADLVPKALTNLGSQVENVGNEWTQQQAHLDVLRADSENSTRLQDLAQKFQQDSDYKTFPVRAQASIDQINSDTAGMITNPRARAEFEAMAGSKSRRVYHEILTRGTNLARQDTFDTTSNWVANKVAPLSDPNTTPDQAKSILDDTENAVRSIGNGGLLDPNHQRQILDRHLKGHGGVIEKLAHNRLYQGDPNLTKQTLVDLEESRNRGANAADLGQPGEMPDIRDLTNSPVRSSPRQGAITGIVTHHTSGDTLEGALAEAQKSGTGAGYYIDRDGTIYRGAPDGSSTVHIRDPNSRYRNGNNPDLSNANTVGIEYVGKDAKDITPEQLASGQKLIGWLANQNQIKVANVVGHGEIQGGPRGNKEEDEGVAAAKGYRDAANAPPQAPKVAGNSLGGTPSGWADIYARMSPEARERQINNARVALHQTLLTEANDAKRIAADTGQIPKDKNGQTVIEHAQGVLTGNQQTRIKYQVEGGLNRYNAVSPLNDMDDDQARKHLDETLDPNNQVMSDGKTPLPYSIAAKNQDYARKAYKKIQDQRSKDPAEAAYSSKEVDAALNQIHGQFGDINSPNADPAVKTKAWGTLFDARLAFQQRVGIREDDQSIMTVKEAKNLFGTESLSRMSQGRAEETIKKATELATQLYGPYASLAIQDSIKVLHAESKAASAGYQLGIGLLTGQISPGDLLQVGQFRRGLGTPRPYGVAPEPAAPPSPTEQPATPASPQRGLRPGMPPRPSSGVAEPSDGHVMWLGNSLAAAKTEEEKREIRRHYNSKFPGAAKRDEDRARSFFEQQDRGRF